MDMNKQWKEVTALFLISIAVFGVADYSHGTEQTFSETQEQMTDTEMQTGLAQADMNSEETTEQEIESEDASEQETESENVASYVEDFSNVDSISDRTVPEGKKIREFGVTYVSDVNRYNKLTPRVSEYLEFLENGTFSMQTFAGPRRDISLSEWEEDDITVKLYDFWQLGKPVLYLWHKQKDRVAFEGFFALWGEETTEEQYEEVDKRYTRVEIIR